MTMRPRLALLAVFGWLALATLATPRVGAAPVTLQDGNSTFDIDPATQFGAYNWIVDGVDHLFQEWFWIRVNGVDTQEFSIDNYYVSQVASDTTGNGFDDTLVANFNRAGLFTMTTRFSLLGGTAGSGFSDVGEQVRLINTSDRTLSFSLFEYTDFDLGGSAAGDTGLFVNANLFRQTKSPWMAEVTMVPTPSLFQVAGYPSLLNDLNDNGLTNLNNTPPIGTSFSNDVTFAAQWNFTLAPNETFLLSKDKLIIIIPEPSSVILAGTGLVGLISMGLRRRLRPGPAD